MPAVTFRLRRCPEIAWWSVTSLPSNRTTTPGNMRLLQRGCGLCLCWGLGVCCTGGCPGLEGAEGRTCSSGEQDGITDKFCSFFLTELPTASFVSMGSAFLHLRNGTAAWFSVRAGCELV